MAHTLVFEEEEKFRDRLDIACRNLVSGSASHLPALKPTSLVVGNPSVCSVSISNFAAWAIAAEWKVPPELAARAECDEQIDLAWEGFDPESPTYPSELDIAFQTWRAVTNNLDPVAPPKEQLRKWVDDHYPDLAEEAKNRISTVCNWKKTGGRPQRD